MSGPKLSKAEIERRRQEQLERERQEAIKRLREAQQDYRSACEEAAALKEDAKVSLTAIDAAYAANARQEVREILSRLVIKQAGTTKDPAVYHALAQSIRAETKVVKQKVESCLNKSMARTQTGQKLGKADQIQQSFGDSVQQRGTQIGVTQLDFRSSYGDQLQARREDQARRNAEAERERRRAEMQALYGEYAALAAILDTVPKPPAFFADAQALRAETKALYAQYQKKDEMDFIADQINDAMLELGYTLLSSRVLTRKKDHSEMDCSLYQADEETGITVFTDQNGAVMMRLTVLGDDADITDDDREFSFQRQIDFCASHPDIVDALAARGVFLKQDSYAAPDPGYTYKANVNAAGATQQQTASGQDVVQGKVNRRRRRSADRNSMHKM